MSTIIPTDNEIRLRAYHLWDINGRQDGRELDYWLQAALELEDVANNRASGTALPAPATVAGSLDRPAHSGPMRRSG